MTNGTTTIDYQYNSDGLRTQKVVTTTSDHVHVFQDTVRAPTCTENGYTLHECICGYIYQDSPVAATGHNFTTTVVGTNCTEVGHTVYTCACGYSYEDGSNGHNFTALVIEPSETVNGFTLHQCDCGYSYESDPVASLAGAGDNTETVSDVKVYDYVYNGSSLTQLTITTTITGDGTSAEELYFTYDGSSPMSVTYGNDIFYYVTNLQGDVIAILNDQGVAVVTYTYDAWGNILTTSGTMANTLGVANPLTYRGYVFDTESSLYYLQSRYYNPEVGRFINADALMSTGQGLLGNNMFAYCLNNPVNSCDYNGESADSYPGQVGEELGKLIYEWITGKEHPSHEAETVERDITQKRNEQFSNGVKALGKGLEKGVKVSLDALNRGYNINQENQNIQNSALLEGAEYYADHPKTAETLLRDMAGTSTAIYMLVSVALAGGPTGAAIGVAALAVWDVCWTIGEIITDLQ